MAVSMPVSSRTSRMAVSSKVSSSWSLEPVTDCHLPGVSARLIRSTSRPGVWITTRTDSGILKGLGTDTGSRIPSFLRRRACEPAPSGGATASRDRLAGTPRGSQPNKKSGAAAPLPQASGSRLRGNVGLHALRVAQADVQLTQLLLVHRPGRLREQVLRPLGLGEGDDITQRLGAGHEHDEAVQADGDAAVRRGAVLQRVQQEAELRLGFFLADLQRAEHLALHVFAVDPHRSATELDAVQ